MIFDKTGTHVGINEKYIVGCDVAAKDSIDHSCSITICLNCKTVIDSRIFQNGVVVDYKPPERCQVCGTIFQLK